MSDWTLEQDKLLRALIDENLSASEIAGRMRDGRTRNAIIGRAGRLGLTIGANRAAAPKKVRPPKRQKQPQSATGLGFLSAKPRAPEPPPAAEQAEPAPDQPGVRMIDVLGRNGRCKFYLPGHEGLQGFVCGDCTETDRPYCAHHHAVSRTALRERAA